MAQAITDPLASLLNTQGQLQVAKYGRPGVGGNLSGTLGYLADFIKGVYSMPEGSPGIFGGIAEVLNRYNVRQYADQEFQAKQAQLARQLYEQEMQRQQLGTLTGIAPKVYLSSENLNAARPYAENMATNESLDDYVNKGIFRPSPYANPTVMGTTAKDAMARQQQIADANATLKGVQGAYQSGSQGQNPYGTPTAQPTKNMPLLNMDPNVGPLQGGVNAQSAPSILGGVIDIAQLLAGGKQGTEQYNQNRTYGLDQRKLQEVVRSNQATEGIQGMNAQTSRMNANETGRSNRVSEGLRAKELSVKEKQLTDPKPEKLNSKLTGLQKQLDLAGVLNKDGSINMSLVGQPEVPSQGGFLGAGAVSVQTAAKNKRINRIFKEYTKLVDQMGSQSTAGGYSEDDI